MAVNTTPVSAGNALDILRAGERMSVEAILRVADRPVRPRRAGPGEAENLLRLQGLVRECSDGCPRKDHGTSFHLHLLVVFVGKESGQLFKSCRKSCEGCDLGVERHFTPVHWTVALSCSRSVSLAMLSW